MFLVQKLKHRFLQEYKGNTQMVNTLNKAHYNMTNDQAKSIKICKIKKIQLVADSTVLKSQLLNYTKGLWHHHHHHHHCLSHLWHHHCWTLMNLLSSGFTFTVST